MNLISLPSVQCKLEMSQRITGMTSFAGLGLVLETMTRLGIIQRMKQIGLKQAGYSDEVSLSAMVMLLVSGGRSLSDWDYLKTESGFARMFGLVPSVDVLERYLERLAVTELTSHVSDSEENQGRAGYTTLLEDLHHDLIRRAWKNLGCPKQLTLDIDTTIIETDKSDALYCYEKVKAYQPMNAYCPELGMVLAQEFRDGNISPQLGYKRLVKRCQDLLPVTWTVRSDSAGYQNDFLDWMLGQKMTYYMTAKQPEVMSGRIFRISEKSWQTIVAGGVKTGQEVALLEHYPSFSSQEELKIRMRERRYLVIRCPLQQLEIETSYRYQVIVTNDLVSDLSNVVKKHRGRCGSVEYLHSQLYQLGMDKLPSGKFEVNAAWFSLGCFAHNLLRFMQRHLLPEELKSCEIQTLRFRFLRAVAIVIRKARGVIMRFCKDSLVHAHYLFGRRRLEALSP